MALTRSRVWFQWCFGWPGRGGTQKVRGRAGACRQRIKARTTGSKSRPQIADHFSKDAKFGVLAAPSGESIPRSSSAEEYFDRWVKGGNHFASSRLNYVAHGGDCVKPPPRSYEHVPRFATEGEIKCEFYYRLTVRAGT